MHQEVQDCIGSWRFTPHRPFHDQHGLATSVPARGWPSAHRQRDAESDPVSTVIMPRPHTMKFAEAVLRLSAFDEERRVRGLPAPERQEFLFRAAHLCMFQKDSVCSSFHLLHLDSILRCERSGWSRQSSF